MTTTTDDYFHQTMRFLYHAEYFLRRHLQPTDGTESSTSGTGTSGYDSSNVPYYAFGSGSSEPNIFTTNGSTPPPHETPAGYTMYNGNNNNNNYGSSSGHDMNDLTNNNPYDASPATSSVGTSQQSRGRTVLTILYLCVLGLCFVVPVFYYFRLHCFEESARRELELDFTAALQESEQHREEHRAARRKYLEERRARIVQLFGPVRMILREANFPHLSDPENAPSLPPPGPLNYLPSDTISKNVKDKLRSSDESATMASEDVFSPYTSEDDDEQDDDNDHDDNENDHDENDNANENEQEHGNANENETNADNNNNSTKDDENDNDDVELMESMEKGILNKPSADCEADDEGDHAHTGDERGADSPHPEEEILTKTTDAPTPGDNHNKHQHNPYGDEDTYFIKIPVPGLPCNGSSLLDPTKPLTMDDMKDREMRLAPGLCSICLSNYKVGSDIVWSSNENCDHHFHANCIERWLLKQREGPLCPCCRQDFVVDPFDLLEEEGNTTTTNNNDNGAVAAVFQWDPTYLDMDDSMIHNLDGPTFVGAPGESQISDDEGASTGTGGNHAGDNHNDGGHAVDLEEGQQRRSEPPAGMDDDGNGQIELVASDGDMRERNSAEEEGEAHSQSERR